MALCHAQPHSPSHAGHCSFSCPDQGKATMDALQLQLQNHLYEKLHLLQEIDACQSYQYVLRE